MVPEGAPQHDDRHRSAFRQGSRAVARPRVRGSSSPRGGLAHIPPVVRDGVGSPMAFGACLVKPARGAETGCALRRVGIRDTPRLAGAWMNSKRPQRGDSPGDGAGQTRPKAAAREGLAQGRNCVYSSPRPAMRPDARGGISGETGRLELPSQWLNHLHPHARVPCGTQRGV